MKLFTAAALAVATLAGAASAATEGQLNQIERFAPSVDVQALTDTEVAKLLSVIHSGDTDSEKRAVIAGLLR